MRSQIDDVLCNAKPITRFNTIGDRSLIKCKNYSEIKEKIICIVKREMITIEINAGSKRWYWQNKCIYSMVLCQDSQNV